MASACRPTLHAIDARPELGREWPGRGRVGGPARMELAQRSAQCRRIVRRHDDARAGFLNDDFVKTLAPKDLYNRKANKFLDAIIFVGPFKPAKEPASRANYTVSDRPLTSQVTRIARHFGWYPSFS